jgi:hypothetical protein
MNCKIKKGMQSPLSFDLGRGVFSLGWNHLQNISICQGNSAKGEEKQPIRAAVAVGSRLLERENKVSKLIMRLIRNSGNILD